MDLSCTELQLLLLCPPRVALSDGACESDIHTLSEKICEYKVQYNRKYTI